MKTLLLLFFCYLGIEPLVAVERAVKATPMQHSSPFAFRENKGQIANMDYTPRPDVLFQAKLKGIDVFLLKDRIVYQFTNIIYPEGYKDSLQDPFSTIMNPEARHRLDSQIQRQTYRMDMKLLGANTQPTIEKDGKSTDYLNFYTVPCPADSGCTEVYSYSKVTLKNIYSKIDWVIYSVADSSGGVKIKYDFVVHPGGNPKDIRFFYTDAEGVEIDSSGGLQISNRLGTLAEAAPYSTQAGKEIPSSYFRSQDTFSYAISNYNLKEKLVIDPIVRVWATYYGGSGTDEGFGCSTDTMGNIYLSGNTNSSNNIAFNGFRSIVSNMDAFLVKFNDSGVRIWATYYGGTNNDYGTKCKNDNALNIYLVGYTLSNSNIAFSGHQNVYSSNNDAFLVKFNASGARIWATYYGGTGHDYGYGCSVDNLNNVYICGNTASSNNIGFNSQQNVFAGWEDAFLVKFNSNGTRLWGRYYGGIMIDVGSSCAVDNQNNVYMIGTTSSSTGIAINGHLNTFTGVEDAFLVKFNSNGIRSWGTYYGGSNTEIGSDIALDNMNNIFLCGHTTSDTGISFNGFQNNFSFPIWLNEDAFLVKFNSNGVRLWGTYYGWKYRDLGYTCITDKNNNVYLGGSTDSYLNIVYKGFQHTFWSGYLGLLVKFNSSGQRIWSTYYGGGETSINAMSINLKTSSLHFGGSTTRTTYIASNGFQNVYNGNTDAFLVKFDTCEIKYKDSNINLCFGSYYIFKNDTISSNITLKDTFQRLNGCDSIVSFNFFFSNQLKDSQTVSICGSSYLGRTQSGIYRDTFIRNGCDSFKILNLTLRPKDSINLNIFICKNQPYLFNNQSLNASGLYRDTFQNRFGCDSFVFLNLTVNKIDTTLLPVKICQGQSYSFNGQFLTTAGIYKDTLVNSKNCDSFIFLNLSVQSTPKDSQTVSICGSSYLGRTQSGIYRDTFIRNGCDSFKILNLTLRPKDSINLNIFICKNQPYLFNNQSLNASGLYRDTFQNRFGCDSFVFLNLTVNKIDTTLLPVKICQGQSYSLNGQFLTTAGIYKDTLVNSKNCDSFIFLNLSVQSTPKDSQTVSICGSSYLGRTQSGIYRDTFIRNGCDSFKILNLTLRPKDSINLNIFICKNQPYLFNNQSLNASGLYRDTFQNRFGCDSFVFLNLTVNKIDTTLLPVKICQGQSYSLNGQFLTTAGIYKDTLVNSKNCDSFIFLNLSVQSIPKDSQTVSICGSSYLGRTQSGIYRDTFIRNDCDSISVLKLTLLPIDTTYLQQEICEGSFFPFNNQSLTLAGIYSDTQTNILGCDSFIILDLKVNPKYSISYQQIICKGNSFLFDGVARSQAGFYTQSIKTTKGCDSITTMELIVLDTARFSESKTICAGEEYKGYSTTGIHKQYLSAASGCDSVYTLNLTVLNASFNTAYITICKGSSYKGFKDTGVHSLYLSNQYGCDSTVEVHLSFYPPITNTSKTLTICKGQRVTINHRFISTAGLYTDTLASVNGCDSLVYITLKVLELSPRLSLRDTSICVDDSLKINAPIGYLMYTWNNGTTLPYLWVSQAGQYSLKVMDTNRCVGFDTVQVARYPLQKLTITAPTEVEKADIFVAKAEGNAYKTLQWQPASLFVCDTCAQNKLSLTSTTMLYLYYTDNHQCRYKDSLLIDVASYTADFEFPNAFSPNGDNKNDYFYPEGNYGTRAMFQIYNRWGEKVFESSLAKPRWDGTYKGEPQPTGVYSYYGILTLRSGKTVVRKGTVTLIR